VSSAGTVALVTGCSRAEGLGFEVCKQLAEQGITVLLTARDEVKAHALAAELQQQGGDVMGCSLDISSDKSVQAVAKLIDERYGKLDILVNNATGSTTSADPASRADLSAAHQVIDVTLFGTWRVI